MQTYLNMMGIDRWVRRQNIAPTLPACYAHALWHQGREVGLLFAAASCEDAGIAALLKKIITAIRCESYGRWYFTQPTYTVGNDLCFVITLGEGFEVIEGVAHIHSYSPQQLLSQPQLKVETWKKLKSIFALL